MRTRLVTGTNGNDANLMALGYVTTCPSARRCTDRGSDQEQGLLLTFAVQYRKVHYRLVGDSNGFEIGVRHFF